MTDAATPGPTRTAHHDRAPDLAAGDGAREAADREAADTAAVFPGDSQTAAWCRALDWAATPLGPVAGWPQSLRTAVSVVLASRFPMMIHWGPELVHLYNDGYAAILQGKHPGALGAPARDWWPEIWDQIGPIFDAVWRGETTYFADALVLPDRRGFVEECYFTFCHSPIRDEAGAVGGIFVTAVETTAHVVSQRRLATLAELGARAAALGAEARPAEAGAAVVAALAGDPDDVPFVALCLRAGSGVGDAPPDAPAGHGVQGASRGASQGALQVAAAAGVEPHGVTRDFGDAVARVLAGGPAETVAPGRPESGAPGGRRAAPVGAARVLPLDGGAAEGAGARAVSGVLVAGLSPRRPLDAEYLAFLDTVAERAATALVAARAAAERERLLAAERGARAEAETAAAQLRAQGLELELASQQTQEQAAELEAQAEELQATAAHLEEQTEAADRAREEAEAVRRVAEAAEARLQTVFAQAPVSMVVTEGPEHRFTLVNAQAEAFTRRRDLVGQTYVGAYPELADSLVVLLDRVYATGEPVVTRESRVAFARPGTPAAGGSTAGGYDELYLDLVFQPLREPGASGVPGPVTGILHFAVDVTARKRAELERERLLAESERARAEAERARGETARVLAATDDGLLGTDLEGCTTFANPAAERLLGYTSAELVGRPQHALIHHTRADGTPYPAAECPLFHARRAGRSARVDGEVFWRKDGTALPVEYAMTPVVEGGAVTGAVVTFRDVSARRAADAERARLLAAERAARAAADAANQAKSQFLANMSHELRTPLNAIGGYAQLLELGLHGPVTDDQRGALARVQAAQRRLLALINDVLNYAKLEGGRVEYDLRSVDVRDVVADVVPLVEPQLAAKGLALDVRLPERDGVPVPCVVRADRDKLGQVLVNLLSNAVKFTDARHHATGAPGRVTVDVATPRDAPAGADGAVFLRVSDTGRGIPVEKQAAIFEPFVQVRPGAGSPYAQATEGTGLGLAISRDLARGMGGDLRVRSREGAGATFTVTLRRAAPGLPSSA